MTDRTASYRVQGVELALDESDSTLAGRAASAVGLEPAAVRGIRIARKALDARVRGGERRMRWVCNVDLVLDERATRSQAFQRALRAGRATPSAPPATLAIDVGPGAARAHAVVVGAGPAGLFAAFALARNGVRATIVERGPPVEARGRPLVRFHRTRVVDPEANLLFGEGGAGTYSDGKIYTRVDDPLEVTLLEELVAAGAPPAIVYDSLAHIGTDRLHRILPAFRAKLEGLGVRFLFDARVDGLVVAPGEPKVVRGVRTTRGELECDALFVAVGHSARDAWAWLERDGVRFEAKPFQLGVRVEHPQELIDRARYGDAASVLGAASYNLIARADGRTPAAFSFCMCPGGRIVASVNEHGLLCTNGMSNSTHSSGWATAALVTTFGPREFGDGAFDGVRFQRELEARFFAAGGGDYTAPAQAASDFVAGRASARVRRSTYPFGTIAARVDELVPPLARDAIARALRQFDRQIPGFSSDAGLLVGLESRSSGPVRMPRDKATRLAVGFANLHPLGEGAGYAGGIMSAALDGANGALAWLRSLAAR